MAQETDAQLQTRRGVIENETTEGANTTERVGDMFENIIDSKINNDKIIDEDTMSSDSATHVPTQQSVKAYVDSLGITREFDRVWDAELLFDKNEIHYAETTLAGDVEFTINPAGNLEDQFCAIVQEIITDGTHEVTFTGFKYVLGDVQSGTIPEAGTHIVFFLYFNGIATVNWSIPTSEVANLLPLSAPANFAAVADGDTEIDLSWDAVTNVTNYEIYYSTTGGGGPWTLLTEPAAGATTYSHTGLTAATTYHYQIRAIGDQVTFANSQYSTDATTTEDAGDVTDPTFISSPADAATDVPMNRVVVFTSDEALRDADGVTAITDANILDYLTAVNSSAAAQSITATIDVTKKIITITPDVVWTELDDITITLDGVEDLNGNEPAAFAITFTTNDFTEMNVNHLSLGSQIDAIITGSDKNFQLEVEVQNYLKVASDQNLFRKSSASIAQKALNVSIQGDDVHFVIHDGAGAIRNITWEDALLGITDFKIMFDYFGAIDTNNGLDRVDLYVDEVLVASGKTLTASEPTWPFHINTASTQPFYLSGPVLREAKNFIVRNNSGATVQVNIPVIRTGTDTSGNSFDGTWI